MKRMLTLVALLLLLSSHELFLKTEAYYLAPHQASELYLFNGTFDTSENTITRDRIVQAKILGPKYEFLPKETDYYDQGDVTFLKFQTGNAGTYVAGVSTLPNAIELSATNFQEYLEHEGLAEVVEERKRKGIDNASAREKYSKHVKAILQVSDQKTKHFQTALGYPIEFIPLHNPYSLKIGNSLTLKLLRDGQPLADQIVHYSCRSGSETRPVEEQSTRTDQDGIFAITISETGQWYVATIHMTESQEEDFDYESNWATLTFGVK